MTQHFFANPSTADMPKTADVVIIGGGPAGAAALWAIERAAPGTQTVLIESSSQLASGSSSASLENFRTCWPTLCLMKLMTRSVEVFHHADEYLGEGAAQVIGLRQQGYLYVGFTPADAARLKAEVAHLHAIGLPHIEFLDAAEVRYRYPWLGERVTAAKYDPIAGWLDSHALTYRFAQNAPHAKILLEVPDTRIVVENNRVAGVATANGTIATPNVIIAAGANARQVGRTAGIELPIDLRPRQSFTTPWRHPDFPSDAPCVISAAPFPHVRPEARDGAIFGWEYAWNTKNVHSQNSKTHDSLIDPLYPVDQFKDPRFPSVVLTLMARHFGHTDGYGFADSRYLRGVAHRAGYYVYRDHTNAYFTAPDGTHHPYESQRAIIDAWNGIDGLFLSIAHVGHGIMSSPAGGEIVASLVLRRDLPDSAFADFGLAAYWVEHDTGGLGLSST